MAASLDDGKKFDAKYTMGDRIAGGGYGVVCKGVNKNTREQVAIKVILRDNYDKGDIPRLAVEVALCKRLSHKHLIRCYDVYSLESQKSSQVRIVMELAKGEELFTLIQDKGTLEESVTKIIIYQLLLALQYLHSQNIIFRDVKPENILLKEPYAKGNYHTLLCDFGLAVVKGEEKARGAFGSVYYIAPEELTPNEYCEKVDVWAAGIVAHACVAGFPPFCTDDQNNDEILKLIEKTDLDITASELSKSTSEIKDFLQRTICRDVNKRLTASQALEHEWFASLKTSQKSAVKPQFSNYKAYVKGK
ncbi:myosin light chain kinase A-like [Convolutriloba macropyga]|uniref:myosin light chain kinase A-like n=1 Tax=Convolutriloba macropyga TaxID=536237 RepID=UPI003F51D4C5